MAIKLEDIRALVRAELADPGSKRWSDADLNRWINQGRREVARIALIFEAYDSSISTVGGTQEYSLPADFMEPKYVTWNDWPLGKIGVKDGIPKTVPQGTPSDFYYWAGKMGLYPIPGSVASLKIWYYKVPSTDLVDGNSIDLTVEDEDLYVLFAVSRAKRQDQDWGEASYYENKFEIKTMEHGRHLRSRGKLGPQYQGLTSRADIIRTGKIPIHIP